MRTGMVLMATAGALMVAGCSGIVESIVEDQLDRGSLSCTIDGSAYRDDVAYMEVHENTVKVYAGKLSGTSDSQVMELVFERASIPGTVQLNAAGSRASWRPQGSNSSRVYRTYDGSGTATVTRFDGNRCQGSFSFVAQDSDGAQVTVTNGSFSVGVR